MLRPSNQTTVLALTALIMAAGTSAHAQFQFLTDQPLNATDTPKRNARNDEAFRPAPPAPATPAQPEQEKKGFFGRLFSRDPQPARAQTAPSVPGNYPQPGTTYVRDGVRYSNPPGYAPAPAPVPVPVAVPQWTQPQPVAPQYTPQGQVNPSWPPPADPRFSGAADSSAAGTQVIPPNGQMRSFETRVVNEAPRYAPGAEPTITYSLPAAAPTATPKSGPRNPGTDVFSGQRSRRAETSSPAAPQYEAPAAVPVAPWPPVQTVAPQYPPQGNAAPSWPDAQSDPRNAGAQGTAATTTMVIPPNGTARPVTVPEGYPAPPPRGSSESLDRPGFFSRLFGASAPPAAAPVYSVNDGTRYAPGAKIVTPRIQDDSTMRPLPAPAYQPPPAPQMRAPAQVPSAPVSSPQQDPFSGQRPGRRSTDYVPEVPVFAPTPAAPVNPAPFGTPRSSLDAAPVFPSAPVPANLTPAEERAFQPGVKPEDTRYLMYLYAKTGRADLAEPLAQEILSRDPANKEALLAMSSLFVDKKDAPRAVAYATQLYQAYPDSTEAIYYYGAAHQLAGDYQEAENVLRYLRLEKFAGKPFPYQLDLAGASEKSGNWRGQMTAYQELLDQNQVDDPTRTSVRRVLEPMQRDHSDQVAVQGTAYLLKSGALWQERSGQMLSGAPYCVQRDAW